MLIDQCSTSHEMQMYTGAISKLSNGFGSIRAINHSLKLVDYLLVQKHKLLLIAPFADIPKLIIKYLAMHQMQIQTC